MHLISSMSPMPSLVSSYGLLVWCFFSFLFLLPVVFSFFSFLLLSLFDFFSSVSFFRFFLSLLFFLFFSNWLKSDVHMRSDRYYVI